jgi:hypothetical protein
MPRISNSRVYALERGDPGISINQEIFGAKIRVRYQHTPMVLAVNVINSGLVTVVFALYLQQTRSNIRLVIRAAQNLCPAWVDPNQLELAILKFGLECSGCDA